MSHYFDKEPQAQSQTRQLSTRIEGIDLCFTSDTDVFSRRQIDFGSRLLLDTVITDLRTLGIKRGRLLDLGCGYGVIGITMKRAFPALEVVLADINQRALALSKINAEGNHCPYVEILSSDGWTNILGEFELVLTNPPVRAGKKTVFAFYEGAQSHLKPGGYLYVVLQKKQGAPSSFAYLETLFGNCDILAKDSGYWIMRSQKEEKGENK